MNELMEVLFGYAQAHLLPGYLCRDEAYAASDRCAERQEELVRAALGEGGQVHFEALLDELEITQFARDRAAFLCGFHLARELLGV